MIWEENFRALEDLPEAIQKELDMQKLYFFDKHSKEKARVEQKLNA